LQLGILTVLVMLLIVDFLFLGDDQFKYDPDFKNWSRALEPKY